ncbi:Transposable element P transposase, partial [Stegodyphus mimosarum]
MSNCAVALCQNYRRKTKNQVITYHRFPSDPDLGKLWIVRCKRADNFNTENARICSVHFTPDDYIRDLKPELLGLTPKRFLKANAVPTLPLPSSSCENNSPKQTNHICCTSKSEVSLAIKNSDSSDSSRFMLKMDKASRCQARETRKRALETLASLFPKKKKLQADKIDRAIQYTSSDTSKLIQRVEILEKENKEIKYVVQSTKNAKKKTHIFTELAASRKKLRNFQKMRRKVTYKKVQNEVKKILGTIFTDNQIRFLVSNKKFVKWNADDICKSATLRAVSRRCYSYLRQKMGFPLPSISTLKRWVSCSFRCSPGLLHDVLQVMRAGALKMTIQERMCVLSFDEMNVDSRICYDQAEDKIVGPHRNVQVIMVRGLFASWKQPIYFDFDTQMTAELLKKTILSLAEIGYNVVAVVSDLGGRNRAVWSELQITHLESSFTHPDNSGKRVWVFADVPHLLKLLRNHFLDDGLTLPGNKLITKEPIERLLSTDCKEVRICPKLSASHITVKGNERQRVYLAAQLFSNHTAQGIRYLMPEEEDTANFFELVNNSFDILNARKPVTDTVLACAYGIHEVIQERTLKKFYELCDNMRVGKTKHLLPFQKGFMMSIRSLLGLFSDMKQFGVKYLLTSKLNQDCLENLFSRIRGLGHFYDHPLPVDVKYRMRLLLLTHNDCQISLSNTSSVAPDEEEDAFITSHFFGNILPDMSEALKMLDGETEMRDIVLDDSPLTSTSEPTADCSVQGFRYLAGYIAYRGRKYDHSLGTPTEQLLHLPSDEHVGWIETLSRGGLLVPSEEWLKKINQFEAELELRIRTSI